MGRLENKVAIVTGAGCGIGRAIALLFAKEGAKVAVADIVPESARAVAEEIAAAGGAARAIVADVTREEHVQNMVDAAVNTFGTVDIVVNNVGLSESYVTAEEVTDELWEHIFDLNLKAPMRVIRKVLPIFTTKKSGNIINMASACGLFGSRAGAAYTASKHGVVGLTKNVGFQYATQGVRCNAIAPGLVGSRVGGQLYPDDFGEARAMAGEGLSPRVGTPEEIAGIALFLASDESSFVNGTTIAADAGWTAY